MAFKASLRGLFVCGPWGESIGRITAYEAFKKAGETATIEGFRFHDLRHTAVCYLVMGDVDLATVKNLGHREIRFFSSRRVPTMPRSQCRKDASLLSYSPCS